MAKGYLSMPVPPAGYPSPVAWRDRDHLSEFHSWGNNCCSALFNNDTGKPCTIPAWLPHSMHESWSNWGTWSAAPTIPGLINQMQATWPNDKFVPPAGESASAKAAELPDADWPGEDELLCPRATLADANLMTIEQLDALDHERILRGGRA